MKGFSKKLYIYILILSITVISIAGGLISLYLGTLGRIPSKVLLGSHDLGGLTKKEAVDEINKEYGQVFKNGELVINYSINNDKKQFKVKYNEIDASINSESTVEKILNIKGGERLKVLLESNFLSQKRIITPDIHFSKEKLAAKLENLSAIIDREPQNANIYLIDDKVTKEAEEDGLKLNIDNSIKKIEDEIRIHLDKPIEFDSKNKFEIKVTSPEITSDKLKYAQEVISSYTTEIRSREWEKSVRLAARAINKVWIEGSVIKGEEPGEFSFNEYLSKENGIKEQNNEGYNQVVSTLNAALMKAGLDDRSITKTPHKTPTDYIEPGLDAVVFGNTIDYRFKNTLDGVIVIFTSIRDNKLTVSLVGKKKDKDVLNSLEVEIEQKYAPNIINVENRELQDGQKRIICEGTDGLKVNVYRVTTRDGIKIDRKLLYNESYKPQDRIVQMNTGIKPGTGGIKEK